MPELRLAFSAGLTTADAADSADHIYHPADRALYSAKAAGRNRSRVIDRAGIETPAP